MSQFTKNFVFLGEFREFYKEIQSNETDEHGPKPPFYPLYKIKTPTVMYYGANDALSTRNVNFPFENYV